MTQRIIEVNTKARLRCDWCGLDADVLVHWANGNLYCEDGKACLKRAKENRG